MHGTVPRHYLPNNADDWHPPNRARSLTPSRCRLSWRTPTAAHRESPHWSGETAINKNNMAFPLRLVGPNPSKNITKKNWRGRPVLWWWHLLGNHPLPAHLKNPTGWVNVVKSWPADFLPLPAVVTISYVPNTKVHRSLNSGGFWLFMLCLLDCSQLFSTHLGHCRFTITATIKVNMCQQVAIPAAQNWQSEREICWCFHLCGRTWTYFASVKIVHSETHDDISMNSFYPKQILHWVIKKCQEMSPIHDGKLYICQHDAPKIQD